MGKPSQSHLFQMSMFMCFINLYHVQNILCKGHHSISNMLWVITFWNVGLGKLGKKWFLGIFEVWTKELYWNTINFNDLGAIWGHFWIYFFTLGWIKCIRGASLQKIKIILFINFHENHHCEKHGNTQISPNLSHKLWQRLALACLEDLIKPNQASHQGARWTSSVSMPKVPVLALIIATSAVWPWCRRSFQIIIAELTCGLFPMIFRLVFPSCIRSRWRFSWGPQTQRTSEIHGCIPGYVTG
jgi:hypothetical protein